MDTILTMPNFSNRRMLDKMANFLAGKVFDIVMNKEYVASKQFNDDVVDVWVENCEFVQQIVVETYLGASEYDIVIEGEIHFSSPGTITITCDIDPGQIMKGKLYEKLHFELAQTIRHELQHAYQMSFLNLRDAAKIVNECKAYSKNVEHPSVSFVLEQEKQYMTMPIEMDARIFAWKYLSAKNKQPWDKLMGEYLGIRVKNMRNYIHECCSDGKKADLDKADQIYGEIEQEIVEFEKKLGNKKTFCQ